MLLISYLEQFHMNSSKMEKPPKASKALGRFQGHGCQQVDDRLGKVKHLTVKMAVETGRFEVIWTQTWPNVKITIDRRKIKPKLASSEGKKQTWMAYMFGIRGQIRMLNLNEFDDFMNEMLICPVGHDCRIFFLILMTWAYKKQNTRCCRFASLFCGIHGCISSQVHFFQTINDRKKVTCPNLPPFPVFSLKHICICYFFFGQL